MVWDANGLRPWFTKFAGTIRDPRWLSVVENLYRWHHRVEKYLRNEAPLARVGLVYSQQTAWFHVGSNAKATVEDHNFNYLYEDADGFHFMNAETYDQVQVSKEIVGSSAPYLQENMTVKLSLHGVIPVAIQMPQRATLEVVDTEPVTKGQTASSSYKPAKLSNGVRTNVPPHVGVGTRIVVMTEDGSYVERAKD